MAIDYRCDKRTMLLCRAMHSVASFFSCRHREGSRAVCQAATEYEEGEDAVKRQKSSTAKIALRLGIPQVGGEGRRRILHTFSDITQ